MKALVSALFLIGFFSYAEDVKIGNFEKGESDGWTFYDGKEFPGAQGTLSIAEDSTSSSGYALVLDGDFSAGGGYVSMNLKLKKEEPFKALRFNVKTADCKGLCLRLVDGSNQVHQQNLDLQDTSGWQSVEVKDFKGKGYVKWGGANDAAWHGGLKSVGILTGKNNLKEHANDKGKVAFSSIILEK